MPYDQIARADGQNAKIRRLNPGFETDPVDHPVRDKLDVVNDVLAVAQSEEIGVASAVTFQQVVAEATEQDVRSPSGLEPVIALAPEDVRARGSRARRDDNVIVAIGRRYSARDGRDRQRPAIVEFEHSDNRVRVVRRVDQRQAVFAARDQQDDVAVGVPLGRDVFQHDASVEQDRAEPIGRPVGFDPVLSVSTREGVDVQSVAIDDDVVAESREEHLGAVGAGQEVIAVGPDRIREVQQRVPRPAYSVGEVHRVDHRVADDDHVVFVQESQDQVVAVLGQPFDPDIVRHIAEQFQAVGSPGVLDDVLAVTAREAIDIVAAITIQLIIAQATDDHVGPVAAAHDVVTRAGLAIDRCLNQFLDVPGNAVGEPQRRHSTRAQRADNNQLISGLRERDDQVVAAAICYSNHWLDRREVRKDDRRRGCAGRHLEPVDPVAQPEEDLSVLGEDHAVMPGARRQQHTGIEIHACQARPGRNWSSRPGSAHGPRRR